MEHKKRELYQSTDYDNKSVGGGVEPTYDEILASSLQEEEFNKMPREELGEGSSRTVVPISQERKKSDFKSEESEEWDEEKDPKGKQPMYRRKS